MSDKKVLQLLQKTKSLNWQDKLSFLVKNSSNIVFSTSFSVEDQIILDYIFKKNLNIEVFAIDTGRLPSATYQLWQEVLDKYNKKISVFYPKSDDVANYATNNGINAFYNSLELRHKCCEIRKVEPLKRAIKDKEIWISGLRSEHNINRKDKDFFELDSNLNIVKFYPLLNLSESEVWDYTKKHKIIYNKLYDQGYKSIGCDPCSRQVKEGENARAGRWWWENSNQECGLHMVNGKLKRKVK